MSKTRLVPAVERAFRIMELVANSKRGSSLSEISRKLRLPKSSVHLILHSLEAMSYLQKDAEKGSYRFGLKLVSLSRTALENLDLREVARPWMQKLMQETALTVHLAVLERGEAVIIEKVDAPGTLQMATWVGRRLDVNCTADHQRTSYWRSILLEEHWSSSQPF
jgi:DNA-binding IclR family transcriptional regulator